VPGTSDGTPTGGRNVVNNGMAKGTNVPSHNAYVVLTGRDPSPQNNRGEESYGSNVKENRHFSTGQERENGSLTINEDGFVVTVIRRISPVFAGFRRFSPRFASFRRSSPRFASFRRSSPLFAAFRRDTRFLGFL